MQKIASCLWFADHAEEAATFYVSVFPNSRIVTTSHYPEAGYEVTGQASGAPLTIQFELDGQLFMILNGGQQSFHFNESISFVVNCDTQEKIDEMWGKLSAVPEAEQCGWLKDKYGVSWQIVPPILEEYLSDPDKDKVNRVMTAMLQMHKIDIAGLQAAYEG